MRKLLIIVGLVVAVSFIGIALKRQRKTSLPAPTLPPNMVLAGMDRANATALLATAQELEQAYVDGDFDAYRRLTSDRLFTSTHNAEARQGKALDRTSFKPRPASKPMEGFEEGTLLAAGRVGDTAALYYAVTREWPKIGLQGYPVTVKRFVLRQGEWVMDMKVCTSTKSVPTAGEQWLVLKGDSSWAVDGRIYPAEALLPPVAYPGKIVLCSDAITSVKINGTIVAQTTDEKLREYKGMYNEIYTLDAGLNKGENRIEITTKPMEPAGDAKKPYPPFGTEVTVGNYGPSRKMIEVYKRKVPPAETASISETFLLEHPDAPSHPVTCQTCKQASAK